MRKLSDFGDIYLNFRVKAKRNSSFPLAKSATESKHAFSWITGMVSHLTDSFNGVRKTCWGNMLTYFSFFLSFVLFSNFEASEMLILKLSVKLDFGEGASFVI